MSETCDQIIADAINSAKKIGVFNLKKINDDATFEMDLDQTLISDVIYTISDFTTCCHAVYLSSGSFKIIRVMGDKLKEGKEYLIIRPKH